jgi:hypothetical protein
MSDGLNVQIAASRKAANAISGVALQDEYRLDIKELVDACERAAVPGLMALKSNVMGIRRVSGRLQDSPAIVTRHYRRKVATALVGYRKGKAPHSGFVEFGTKLRTSNRGNRGQAVGQRPLGKAFDSSRSTMEAKLSAELMRLMAAKSAAFR